MGEKNRQTWTTDKPTQPGWYWYDGFVSGPRVVQLVLEPLTEGHDTRKLLVRHENGDDDSIEEWPGQWAGPLEPPLPT